MKRRSMLCRERRFVCLAWLVGMSLLLAGPAQAQFRKTPWPANAAAPALDLTDLQGRRWNAASLKGKVVVLNFWATWCPPCKEEMPTLQTLHEVSEGTAVVLAVNVREHPSRVARYLQATGLSLPVVPDPQGELARSWGVSAYPTTVLIGADGRARWRVVGEVDWSGAEAGGWIAAMGLSGR